MQTTPVEVSAKVAEALAGDIRLMIVDSRSLVRWALTHISSTEAGLHVIAEAETAADATHQIFALKPDVVTVDGSLPDGQGWQLVRDLRAADPDLGVVVLCTDSSDDLIFRALDSGA